MDRHQPLGAKQMALTKDHKEFLRKSTVSLEEAQSNIDSVKCELQEAFDDLSPRVQEGQRGVDLTEMVDQLEQASDEIQQMIDNLYGVLTPQPKREVKA
jgi:hypothetical protein